MVGPAQARIPIGQTRYGAGAYFLSRAAKSVTKNAGRAGAGIDLLPGHGRRLREPPRLLALGLGCLFLVAEILFGAGQLLAALRFAMREGRALRPLGGGAGARFEGGVALLRTGSLLLGGIRSGRLGAGLGESLQGKREQGEGGGLGKCFHKELRSKRRAARG